MQSHLDAGRLVALDVQDPAVLPGSIGLYGIHDRRRPLGIAAHWLLDELQQQSWFE